MCWNSFKRIKDVPKSRFSKTLRNTITLNESSGLGVVFGLQIEQRKHHFEYYGTHEDRARWSWMKRKLKKLVDAGLIPPEYNSRGSKVTREFMSVDRYYYDRRLKSSEGWEQYDTSQDAWYFGVWVNVRTLKIFTYAEGDLILVESPTQAIFIAELKHMAEFYEPAQSFSTIDAEGLTRYYSPRPGDDLIGFSIEKWVAEKEAKRVAANG